MTSPDENTRLYGIEVNLPSQVLADVKFRVMAALAISDQKLVAPTGEELTYRTHNLSFTEKPEKQFATPDKESAEKLAGTYADSWDAAVVPVEEGREFSADDLAPVIEAEQKDARERLRAIREQR